MPWRRFSLSMFALICLGSLLLNSCATPDVSRQTSAPEPPQPNPVQPAATPAPPGKVRQLHIQELAIPQADLNRYPELSEARAGAGLSQILVRALTETGRFDLLTPPAELAQNLAQTWGPGPEGVNMQAAQNPAQTSSAFRLSVKLFDIVACQPLRHLAASQPQASCRSSVGVQVRLEAPFGQFVPGATHPLAPQARYEHPESLPHFGTTEIAFDQSAVGMATAKAIQYALLQAIERLDRQGW